MAKPADIKLSLDFEKGVENPQRVFLRRGDKKVSFSLTLSDNGEPINLHRKDVRLIIRKPEGGVLSYSTGVYGTVSFVTLTLSTIAAQAGETFGYAVIEEGSSKVSSERFLVTILDAREGV